MVLLCTSVVTNFLPILDTGSHKCVKHFVFQTMEEAKALLRLQMLRKLRDMPASYRAFKSDRLVEQLLLSPDFHQSRSISVFLSLPEEPNTWELVRSILSSGRRLFVPQVLPERFRSINNIQGNDSGMCMHRLHSMGQLSMWPMNKWKIVEPPPPKNWTEVVDRAVEQGGLDVIIVPGLAFTSDGHRLGRGGGFYDRYISWYRRIASSQELSNPKLFALAFEEQIVPSIPSEPHDIVVDNVLTA
ncbi:unnamed protein product [Calicophoron daubneyi]|uniref:5-formyltetrahydrofolate cyclo-ligase n=1 Tax=Calicophoron daubneyi TaxID=300641 RepID=A0AAV2TLE5_CALDB